jgi:hypothetical protein
MKQHYGKAVFGMLLDEEAKYRARGKWQIAELQELLDTLTAKYNEMIESG